MKPREQRVLFAIPVLVAFIFETVGGFVYTDSRSDCVMSYTYTWFSAELLIGHKNPYPLLAALTTALTLVLAIIYVLTDKIGICIPVTALSVGAAVLWHLIFAFDSFLDPWNNKNPVIILLLISALINMIGFIHWAVRKRRMKKEL